MNNKKATQVAGTSVASKNVFNTDHCTASGVRNLALALADDNQKPSRENRRQKRGWKNRPKNLLTAASMPWQSCDVAETTVTGRRNPIEAANQPQFIDAAFFASGVPINGGPDGAAARLAGASSVFLPPFGLPPLCRNGVGGIKTANEATIMTKQKRPRAHSRISVFNFIRRFAGPALAYRLSFAGRAA